jgi:phospholipid-translocating ATPase
MSFFKQHQPTVTEEDHTDEENDETIDPELRLRTDHRAEKRRSTIRKRSFEVNPPRKNPTQLQLLPVRALEEMFMSTILSAMEVDRSGEPKLGIK